MSNSSSQVTGNKGEWSELYALIKLLGDGQLQPGNELLEPSEDSPLKVLSIQRNDKSGLIQYKLDKQKVIVKSADSESEISSQDCLDWAQKLLTSIRSISGAKAITETTPWMQALHTTSLKAKSTDKADIAVVLYDLRTGAAPQLGYSVKSFLGKSPTLLNASAHTNIRYQLPACSTAIQDCFNQQLSKTTFTKAFGEIPASIIPAPAFESSVFEQNLLLSDSQLPIIFSHILWLFYQGHSGKSLIDLCKAVEDLNPLKINDQQLAFFYKYKLKRFLVGVALGMKPATLWEGQYEANGGFIIVKKTGALVSYHIYNTTQFESYLLANTYLDKPDISKHKYGKIYQDGCDFFLKLNLQIRFIKR
jgi:HpaII restriction endonuclease